MNKQIKSKCDFCRYKTSSGCMVTANSYNCRDANNEYYQYLKSGQNKTAMKSLRKWDVH